MTTVLSKLAPRARGLVKPSNPGIANPSVSIGMGLVIVIAVGLVLVGPRFLSAGNLTIITSFAAIPILVGLFMGLTKLVGAVDLSVGSMLGFSAVTYASFIEAGWHTLPAAAIALVGCLVFGSINATAIVVFRANPIATTLGMLTALRGLCLVIAGSDGINALQADLYRFASASVGPVNLLFLIVMIVVIIAALVVAKTRFGRHLRASGGDERAAMRVGIRVPVIRFAVVVASALGAGVAGIMTVWQYGGASNQTGFGLELQVAAALMIGGYSLVRNGVGSPIAGTFGLLVVAGVTNITDMTSTNPYFVNLIIGLILLGAVLLDRLRGGDSFE